MVGTGKYENQMFLSLMALHHGFENKTDKSKTGGIPVNFLGQEYIIPWLNLMHNGMEDINNDKSDMRAYGGTKQAEFFIVASVCFLNDLSRYVLFSIKRPCAS